MRRNWPVSEPVHFYTRKRYDALQKKLLPDASFVTRTWGAFKAERDWERAVRDYHKHLRSCFADSDQQLRELCDLGLHDGKVVRADRRGQSLVLEVEGTGYWGANARALAEVILRLDGSSSGDGRAGVALPRQAAITVRLTFVGVVRADGINECLHDICLYEEVHPWAKGFEFRVLLNKSDLVIQAASVTIKHL